MKRFLDWVDIEILVKKLINQISNSPNPPRYITGLPRGGLIPAVMISHALDIPFISPGKIKQYPQSDILIVDDIADSGETLLKYKKYTTAVLHYKPQSYHIPTYYAEEVVNEDWIIYPFERADAEAIQDYLKNK
jgi:hypoxanthine phosphoribosyltransferase